MLRGGALWAGNTHLRARRKASPWPAFMLWLGLAGEWVTRPALGRWQRTSPWEPALSTSVLYTWSVWQKVESSSSPIFSSAASPFSMKLFPGRGRIGKSNWQKTLFYSIFIGIVLHGISWLLRKPPIVVEKCSHLFQGCLLGYKTLQSQTVITELKSLRKHGLASCIF